MGSAQSIHETAPYIDATQAIRAALNVDARSLYMPASWQKFAGSGYRESAPPSETTSLSKLEAFQQDCMTLAFLHSRMPAHQWAVIVVRHALLPANLPAANDPDGVSRYIAEFNRVKIAIMVTAGHIDYDDTKFARWAVANWGGWLDKSRGRWDRWADHDLAIGTLKDHYGRQIKPQMATLLKQSEENAGRLLADAGLTLRGC